MERDTAFDTFGSWVRDRRRKLDLTQAELGRRASCSEATIRKIEADERRPSLQLAGLLARALSIPPNETQRFLQFARGAWTEDQGFGSASGSATANNLPGLLTSTIDRVRDHAAVTALLRDANVRLVTLIGPPGIGKTRLSIHCGNELLRDFADGVWFIDLSEISNPSFFIPTFARVLTNVDLPPSPELAQMVRALRSRRMLLIFDNFEQIADAALDVAQLLKACPGIKVLVTSRQPLHIYGEHEYPLPPLTIPPPDAPITPDALMQYESVELLVARIRLHQPGFMIDDHNAGMIKQICATLEGIPLAVELAAASLRLLSLDEMAGLLRERGWVARIGTPARDLPLRQRTLENVIEWSYGLLRKEEQDFYASIGVLSGWFEASAAAAITATGKNQASALLGVLCDHSLLLRENTVGGIQWRMLEIIRAHASSRLAHPDAAEMLRAQYFAQQLQDVRQNAAQTEQEEYFHRHRSNLHGALDWLIHAGETQLAYSLALQLVDYWETLGYFHEGLNFCRQLLMMNGLQPRQQAILAQAASDLAWQQHDFDTALAFSRQTVELGLGYGLAKEYPLYLNRLGRIYIEQGNLAQAKTALRDAYARSQDAGSMLNPGIPLAQLGEIALFEGDLEQARSLLEQALPRVERDENIFLAMTTTDLAEVALESGNFEEAQRWLAQSLDPSKIHIRRFIVLLSSLAGYLALTQQSSPEMAAGFYGAIEAVTDRSGLSLGAFYKTANERRMQLVRQVLPPSAWQAAFEDGKRWSMEDMVRNAAFILNPKH